MSRSLLGPNGPRSGRSCRPVLAPRSARRRRDAAVPPLLVIAGATATGKTGLSIALAQALAARRRPRRDHLGRLAPGLPGPRHRDRQGVRRPIGPACRTTGSTSSTRTSRSRSPTSRLTRARPWPGSPRVAGSRSSSAGRGCTCGRSARGIDTDALPSDAGLRASLEADLVARRARAARRPAPGRRASASRPNRPPKPPTCRPRARDRRARGRSRRAAAARLRRADALDRARPSTTPRIATWIATRARAQFDAGLVEEARVLRERFDPTLPAFSAIGYREAWAVIDGTHDDRGRDRRGRAPERRLREAPANVVPLGARDRVARCHGRPAADGARRGAGRSSSAADLRPGPGSAVRHRASRRQLQGRRHRRLDGARGCCAEHRAATDVSSDGTAAGDDRRPSGDRLSGAPRRAGRSRRADGPPAAGAGRTPRPDARRRSGSDAASLAARPRRWAMCRAHDPRVARAGPRTRSWSPRPGAPSAPSKRRCPTAPPVSPATSATWQTAPDSSSGSRSGHSSRRRRSELGRVHGSAPQLRGCVPDC